MLRFASDGVAKSHIDVEPRIGLAEHDGFTRKPPASLGSIGEFGLEFTDAEGDIVPKIDIGCGLQPVSEFGYNAERAVADSNPARQRQCRGEYAWSQGNGYRLESLNFPCFVMNDGR